MLVLVNGAVYTLNTRPCFQDDERVSSMPNVFLTASYAILIIRQRTNQNLNSMQLSKKLGLSASADLDQAAAVGFDKNMTQRTIKYQLQFHL